MNWKKIAEKAGTLGKDRFVLLFLAGIMLVIIAMPMEKTKPEKADSYSSEELKEESGTENGGSGLTDKEENLEEYRKQLCLQLKDFLQSMDGVGTAEVYITMHSSSELIVERNSPYVRKSEEETSDGNKRVVGETENGSEVVLARASDGSEEPIVVKEIAPVVKGVVVAAQGGDRESVKNDITELVMALFGIEEHKIKVVKLNT